MRVYRGGNLDAKLDGADVAFVAGNTRVDDARRVIHASRLFFWYASDFGGADGVRELSARYHERERASLAGFRIEPIPYDWSPQPDFV